MNRNRGAFTLVELLVVIAVVAVLSVVVVLVLRPVELLRQTRDAQRISDLNTLNRALGLYVADVVNPSMGQAQTVYVSVPDLQATTTQGTNCASMGLPGLPLQWSYHCAASSTLSNVNGAGWVPVNFQQVSFQSPLATLPVDPANTISSGLYYTYGAGSWNLTAAMESAKDGPGGPNSTASKDGGRYGDLFEIGTDFSLLPVDRPATSSDTTPPTVSITSPLPSATVSGTITVAANATDNALVAGVQFLLDGSNLGAEATSAPYQTSWDTTGATNGSHSLTALARDNSFNSTTSAAVAVTVGNGGAQAPALVQFAVASNASGNVCGLRLNSAVTAGNLLVFTVNTNSSTAALSVAGNLGNSWLTAVSNSSASGTQSTFYVTNAAAGITNATATITNWSAASRSCQLAEYSGVTALDVTNSSSSASGTVLRSGTSTTNFATELVVGGGSFPNCPTCTFSAGAGFTTVAASTVSFQEYATTTSAGAYSATASVSLSTQWLMNMATFR